MLLAAQRRLSTVLLILVVVIGGSVVSANLSLSGTRTFAYQGLLQQNGVNVDGTRDFRFALSTSTATLDCLVDGALANDCGHWQEEQPDVVVSAGAFSAIVGSVQSLREDDLDEDALFLSVAVASPGGSFYLLGTPRQVHATPQAAVVAEMTTYTMQTLDVTGALSADTVDVDGLLQAGSADIDGQVAAGSADVNGQVAAGSVDVNGQVAAGSADISGDLDVGGAIDVTGVVDLGAVNSVGRIRSNANSGVAVFTDMDDDASDTNAAFRFVANASGFVSGRSDLLTLYQDGDLVVNGAVDADSISVPSLTDTDSNSGCVVYSGAQVCWLAGSSDTSSTWTSHSFDKPFGNTSYSIVCSPTIGANDANARFIVVRNLSQSGFDLQTYKNNGDRSGDDGHCIAIGTPGTSW